ncbi:MAG: VOC family protein [Pirellulales bacterium]
MDGQGTTAVRIGFAVPSVDSAFAASLAAGGAEVSAPQDSPWGRRAVVSDPDGQRVELTGGGSEGREVCRQWSFPGRRLKATCCCRSRDSGMELCAVVVLGSQR